MKVGAIIFTFLLIISVWGFGLHRILFSSATISTYTDPITGCEYFISSRGFITPRLNAYGFPDCSKAFEDPLASDESMDLLTNQ